MLEIRVIFNSSVEDVLAFKTCCGLKVFDQNLEILVKNIGDRTVVVPCYFDLVGDEGSMRINALMPGREQRIAPGEIRAFYCTMDETRWKAARRLVMYGGEGNEYPVDIIHQCEAD